MLKPSKVDVPAPAPVTFALNVALPVIAIVLDPLIAPVTDKLEAIDALPTRVKLLPKVR